MRNGKRKKTKSIEFEESSGNVFADVGLPNAQELLAKARLVQQLIDVLATRKLTEAKAAGILGVRKNDVAQLLRGDLDRFTSDDLFRFLNALDLDVEILIRPKRSGKGWRTRPSLRCEAQGSPAPPLAE